MSQYLSAHTIMTALKMAAESLKDDVGKKDAVRVAALLLDSTVVNAIEEADRQQVLREYNEPLREYLYKAVSALTGVQNYHMETVGMGEMRMGCGNTWYYAKYTCCTDPADRFDLISISINDITIGSKRAHELGYHVNYDTNVWTKRG